MRRLAPSPCACRALSTRATSCHFLNRTQSVSAPPTLRRYLVCHARAASALGGVTALPLAPWQVACRQYGYSQQAAHRYSYLRTLARASDNASNINGTQMGHGDRKPGWAGVLFTGAMCFLLGFGAGAASPPSLPAAPPLEALAPPSSTAPYVVDASAKTAATAGQPPLAAARSMGLAADEVETIRIFQDATRSVVNIANVQEIASTGYGYSMDVQKMPVGVGSGFIWDKSGHVVTNFHVIKGASEVRVTLINNETYSAKVVGYDVDKDVAVLQLIVPPDKLKTLSPVTLGTSADLLVGQRVYAIGNPFGLDHSLSSGIISGLNRQLNAGLFPIRNVIQTDASINPGNSGGVLLDSRGALIGINTAIADPTGRGASSGVGFAIPIDTVRGMVDQILQYGKVIRPALGIVIGPDQILRQLGRQGVLVLDVQPGGAAASAGLRPTVRDNLGRLILGDVITSLDGRTVHTYEDLFEILDSKRVGDTISVGLQRGGKEVMLALKLQPRMLGQAE